PKPGVGAAVRLPVAGRGAIPVDAVAVALNVTMTETSQPGFVQVFPTGGAVPGSSSNVNASAAGQTIPNAVVTPLGADGSITLFTSGGTHLLADVSGYFVAADAPVAAGRFSAITPRRVFDTRPEFSIGYSGDKPAPLSRVTVDVVGAAGLMVGDTGAVAVNITPTESTLPGYIQAAAAGGLVVGASSNLNIERSGQTIANMAIVPVGDDGSIELLTTGGAHLLVDVLGWFSTDEVAVSTSGLYVPVSPERVLDTRPASAVNTDAEQRPGLGDTTKPGRGGQVSVFFDGLIPIEPAAVVVNITTTEATLPGYVQAAG
ncbi:MAG TPA: hypothetical protein PLV68_13135, partial [Ilumatobacteraceae bacterium]|nr:hypothetical protein [Ilumatobacteraceae bacterium]